MIYAIMKCYSDLQMGEILSYDIISMNLEDIMQSKINERHSEIPNNTVPLTPCTQELNSQKFKSKVAAALGTFRVIKGHDSMISRLRL